MQMRCVIVLAACAAALALPGAASAATWAPASSAAIHPGVMTSTDGAQCTANFVFTNATGDVFLGQAAHCSGTGQATETDGCTSASLPLGTPVDIGGSQPGTLVYNSWLTMQKLGEKDADTCAYNDLALVKVAPSDVGSVNPSIPFFGGPTGVSRDTVQPGDTVLSYGNSSLRLGLSPLSPKQGVLVENTGGGWSHTVYTLSPGIPGDSGSAFIDDQGRALGVLSTVAIAPLPASNGVGDISRELSYLDAHGGLGDVTLVNGTEPFNGPVANALLAHLRLAAEGAGS